MRHAPIVILFSFITVVSAACSDDKPAPATPASEKAPAAPAPSGDDCKDDLDCFATAAQSCAKKTATYQSTVDMMGMKATTTTKVELLGKEGDRCRLDMTILKQSVELPQAMIDAAKAKGATEADIEALKGGAGGAAALPRGDLTRCALTDAELTAAVAELKALQAGTVKMNTATWANCSYPNAPCPALDPAQIEAGCRTELCKDGVLPLVCGTPETGEHRCQIEAGTAVAPGARVACEMGKLVFKM